MLLRNLAFSVRSVGAACVLVATFTTIVARADLGACASIDVEAQAQCEVTPPGATCEAQCTPVALRASCAVEVAADCQPQCTHLPSVDCQATCSASCAADCDKITAGKFDCAAACTADCSGRCSGECKAKSDQAGCEASCKGSCGASCQVSCDVEPPMADCKAHCDASCQGSCEVDPNLDCQLNCQADASALCEARLEGGCKVNCQKQDGALFCAGQYIDHGDELQACIAALKAKYNVKVSGDAQGSSGCDAGRCSAEGSAHARLNSGCSVTPPSSAARSSFAVLGIGLLALVGLRRGRRAWTRCAPPSR